MATDTDNDGTKRAPGRPYFDPRGARHLADELRRETSYASAGAKSSDHAFDRISNALTNGPRWLDAAVDPEPEEHVALEILEQLDSAVRGVELLFGPAVAAAIADQVVGVHLVGDPARTSRVSRISDAVGRLGGSVRNWRDVSTRHATEVIRLEAELAIAQEAHDILRETLALERDDHHETRRKLVHALGTGLHAWEQVEKLAKTFGWSKRVVANRWNRAHAAGDAAVEDFERRDTNGEEAPSE